MGENTPAGDVAGQMNHWFVLDRRYVIVDARTRSGMVEAHVGQALWDAFPRSRDLYGGFYEEAWQRPMEKLEFHYGSLVRVRAEADGDELHVTYTRLVKVDLTTWESLRRSLDLIEGVLLDAEEASRSDQVAAASLRLV